MDFLLYPPGVRTLGQNIRRVRERAGLDRRALTRALGLAEGSSYVGDLETDRYDNIGLGRTVEIAVACQATIEELVVGINEQYDALVRDLAGHGSRIKSAPFPSERADVAFDAETRLLEQVRKKDAQVVRAITKHASDILKLGAALRKGASADGITPRPRGTTRASRRRPA